MISEFYKNHSIKNIVKFDINLLKEDNLKN